MEVQTKAYKISFKWLSQTWVIPIRNVLLPKEHKLTFRHLGRMKPLLPLSTDILSKKKKDTQNTMRKIHFKKTLGPKKNNNITVSNHPSLLRSAQTCFLWHGWPWTFLTYDHWNVNDCVILRKILKVCSFYRGTKTSLFSSLWKGTCSDYD